MSKLVAGQKYLKIKIVGHDWMVAFKNDDKEAGDNKPDYKSDGVGIWINTKKEPKNEDLFEDL